MVSRKQYAVKLHSLRDLANYSCRRIGINEQSDTIINQMSKF